MPEVARRLRETWARHVGVRPVWPAWPPPGWVLLVALALAVVVVLVLPDPAWARGGGGGHGGGGGRAGGGGGGGYAGGGYAGGGGGGYAGGGGGGYAGGGGFGFHPGIWFLPLLFGGGGSLLLILLVGLAFLFLFARPAGGRPVTAASGFGVAKEVEAGTWRGTEAALAEIQAGDPGFDRRAFVDRVKVAFGRLQKAWQDRDLAAARPQMGQGLYMSWQTQLEQMAALHKRNLMEGVTVREAGIVSASHGPRYEHISVRIDASAADYEVDERTGKLLFGERDSRPFIEYWTFERTTGVRTPEKGGLLDQVCPNCGAPLAVSEIGECDYCAAAVTSGRFDWVLARIDQPEHWRAEAVEAAYSGAGRPAVAPHAEAGIFAIAAADPAFDADAFLERGEMAFFLIEKAWQDRNLEPVRPYLEGALFEHWTAAAAELAARHQRNLLENLNVQSVEVVLAEHGESGDRIQLRIDAVATNRLLDDRSGQVVGGQRSDQRFVEHWTFQRPPGARTPEAGGVLAHRCPSCGRPLTLDEAGSCSACGAAISQGGFDWKLVSVDGDQAADLRQAPVAAAG